MKQQLPENTVERLSHYRRVLLNYQFLDHAYIFSHNLARLSKTNPVTVRRDLMLINVSGDVHKGYVISDLIEQISEAIDSDQTEKVAFIGIGDLGKTVYDYFTQFNEKLVVAAAFKFGAIKCVTQDEVPLYNIADLMQVIKKEGITICVVAVPREFANDISQILVNSGVRGILNFSSVPLQLPAHIYVEQYDMITKLEKIAYFLNRPPKKK